MSRRRVLFIDDDPRILEGIARLLRPKRAEVEVLAAVGGDEALAQLGRGAVDVVISDMRMPGMDGAQLLDEVRRRHPGVVRIILSGQSDRGTILRAVGPAHQFLSKPCDPEVLTATVLRSCALRDLLADEERKRGIASLSGLPCAPSALDGLRRVLADPAAAPQRIAEAVSADLGLSARAIQLTATSFFGTPRGLLPAADAALCLGPDVLRSLLDVAGAFRAGDDDAALRAIGARARARSDAASRLALRVAPPLAPAAAVAGLLAGCGELLPGGGDACDAAAFLTALWGLPDAVVEAVHRSARPAQRPGANDRLAAVVHAAAAAVDGVALDAGFAAAIAAEPG